MVWLSKYNYVPLGVLSIVLLLCGGLPFLLWGVFFRVTMGLQATWMVNCHICGAGAGSPRATGREETSSTFTRACSNEPRIEQRARRRPADCAACY
jgi:hypothetical protein